MGFRGGCTRAFSPVAAFTEIRLCAMQRCRLEQALCREGCRGSSSRTWRLPRAPPCRQASRTPAAQRLTPRRPPRAALAQRSSSTCGLLQHERPGAGAGPAQRGERQRGQGNGRGRRVNACLRELAHAAAGRWWDYEPLLVRGGVLGAGVTHHFFQGAPGAGLRRRTRWARRCSGCWTTGTGGGRGGAGRRSAAAGGRSGCSPTGFAWEPCIARAWPSPRFTA